MGEIADGLPGRAGSLRVPPTIQIGGGVRREVVAHARRLGAARVLVVTDAEVMRVTPASEIPELLRADGIEVAVFDEAHPDPSDLNALAGLALWRQHKCDAIVAIGGGSAIDAAKAIRVLATNPEPLRDYAGYHKIPRPGPALIAIPSTAGTGSEATQVTVITDTERGVKMMILSEHLVPTVALVDYELSLSMPPALTAAVGVDTLTHGIEAYVSRKAHGLTDPLALSCIRLVAAHLRTAHQEPGNRAARAGMMLAACQGGMAFANSSVGLVHGMSRPIGAMFHVPHGLSNAVLLPAVTRYSRGGAVERYAAVARLLGCCPPGAPDAAASESLADGLLRLNEDLKLPRLRDCRGVDEIRFRASLSKMAADALASGSPQNNPRVPSEEEIVSLYLEAW